VTFVLHEVFGYPYAEVAEIVGRTPAACRQLATSARRRLRASSSLFLRGAGSAPRQAHLVRRFKQAWEAKDIGALVGLLDPDATAVADGGGLANTVPHPIEGAAAIARYAVTITDLAPGMTFLERSVNGRPGLIIQRDGVTETVMAFDVVGDRITRIWAVRNPEKLRTWRP
jgi:RNA polymerase sigma-70 factor (ECF subfamily)